MTPAFEPRDVGKRVVTADGDVIGRVESVRSGTAYVRPREGLLDGYGSWVTSCWDDHEQFTLDERVVDRIGENVIRLEPLELEASPLNQQRWNRQVP